MPWSAYDGARISLRQGKARRGGKLGPLIEIPCTAALRRMLDGMDRVVAADPNHEDRTIVQETLFRPTVG